MNHDLLLAHVVIQRVLFIRFDSSRFETLTNLTFPPLYNRSRFFLDTITLTISSQTVQFPASLPFISDTSVFISFNGIFKTDLCHLNLIGDPKCRNYESEYWLFRVALTRIKYNGT